MGVPAVDAPVQVANRQGKNVKPDEVMTGGGRVGVPADAVVQVEPGHIGRRLGVPVWVFVVMIGGGRVGVDVYVYVEQTAPAGQTGTVDVLQCSMSGLHQGVVISV